MNRPPSIPQNYLFYKGTWCHPSRVPREMRLVAQCINDDATQTRQNATQSDFNPTEGIKTPKRIRQSTKPLMNKLESEWFEILKIRHKIVVPQSLRFMLGNGIWYKPDFVVWPVGFESQDTRLWAFECKGPYSFRGGFENLKVAAHKYPQIKWVLVWKENGQWKEQMVWP